MELNWTYVTVVLLILAMAFFIVKTVTCERSKYLHFMSYLIGLVITCFLFGFGIQYSEVRGTKVIYRASSGCYLMRNGDTVFYETHPAKVPKSLDSARQYIKENGDTVRYRIEKVKMGIK